nr:hypothetical protein Itr_chr11CG18830 [Ipomoea trifida]
MREEREPYYPYNPPYWEEPSVSTLPNPHFDKECEHLEKRLLNLIHEAKEDRSNLKVTMKKEIEEELDTFKSDVLQPLKKMEETLAFMIKELTRRINLEAQSITLRSGKTLLETKRTENDPKQDETTVIEEISIHELENKKGLEVENESDEEVEVAWEDEKPCGDTFDSTCGKTLDLTFVTTCENTCAKSCDDTFCVACDDESCSSIGVEEIVDCDEEGAMKILEVITFGNDVGGVKEVEDGIIGDDLDEMEKVPLAVNKQRRSIFFSPVNNGTESETPFERTSREGVSWHHIYSTNNKPRRNCKTKKQVPDCTNTADPSPSQAPPTEMAAEMDCDIPDTMLADLDLDALVSELINGSLANVNDGTAITSVQEHRGHEEIDLQTTSTQPPTDGDDDNT